MTSLIEHILKQIDDGLVTSLIEHILKQIDDNCVATRMMKSGCRAYLTGVPASKVVIDFDKHGSPLATTQRRCDYLVVTECENGNGRILVVELKKGTLKATSVLQQLQAGAVAAEKIISKTRAIRLDFQPIAVVGRVDRHQHERLKRAPGVDFHGKRTAVRTLSCGSSLFAGSRR